MKITFLGAGSTVFAKNVLGDVLCTPALQTSELALYDIDPKRLEESKLVLDCINKNSNQNRAKITSFCGENQRKTALRGADFVINAIQVGGYEPATVLDFEIPKRYGLRQTIGDTLGIGGIMRAMRTIPVLEEFVQDMIEVCPDAWFLNYVNPMAMLTGWMQKHTPIKTIGLCHSVQGCSKNLLEALGLESEISGRKELIAGINHQAWLLSIKDKNNRDLYPEIRKKISEKKESHRDMIRYEYVKKLGYYCTESSEHNAEYNPWFIKKHDPGLIEKFQIPLDEYPRRCVDQIASWKRQKEEILADGTVTHTRSEEYASYILEAITTGKIYQIGGNVLNQGLIENLPAEACVEVPCLVNGAGIFPCRVGKLPSQLAALNMTNVLPQLLTIEAAQEKSREKLMQAVMLEPRCAAELNLDEIEKMCDELIRAHDLRLS